MNQDSGELAQRLAKLVLGQAVVLFAGAGCSSEIKIPIWDAYLEILAAKAEEYEPEIGALMRKRLRAQSYLEAATLFKRTLIAPPGDKFKAMSEPFRPGSYNYTPLLPLASLPFSAMMTTNYDSSLFEGWNEIANQRSSMRPQLLARKITKGAAYITEPFFLFLHGQGSLSVQAEDMVFDEEDYKQCYRDPQFTDGVLEVLSIRTCLFLGFSFRDPGIDAILKMWTALRGPAFPRKHFAILPEKEAPLTRRLTDMNVEVLQYNASPDHIQLWTAIREAAKITTSSGAANAPKPNVFERNTEPFAAARDVLAMCYARATLGKGIQPLRNLVLDGVALAVVTESGPDGISLEDLVSAIAQKLGMPEGEISSEIQLAIERLVRASARQFKQERLFSTGIVHDTLSDLTKNLAERASRRIEIREGVRLSTSALNPLAQVFEDLLMARAYDLAAHFVQPRSGALRSIDDTVSRVVRAANFPEGVDIASIERGLIELLVRPDSKEAELLSDLGRVAFVVQLALGHARSTFAYSLALPQRVYLDASVLLPAIVDGHPMSGVYWPVLERLRDQTERSGGQLAIVAPMEFLNEVIGHRHNAITEVATRNLENPENLGREVSLYGAQNLNVYIGAYATHIGRAKRNISFSKFLQMYAPYTTEDALRQFLERKGLRVEKLARDPELFKPLKFWNWFNSLKGAYESEDPLGTRLKPSILIEHEAWQLLRNETEQREGLRSVFVTADGRLRRAVATIQDGKLADTLLSGLTMVKLVDLLLGVRVDHRGLARLIWGVHAIDPKGILRQRFTDLGLRHRDEAQTLAMPKVVDSIMTEVTSDPAFPSSPIIPKEGVDRASFADFLDRFEDRFYELLDAAVKDYQAEQHTNQAPSSGRERKRHKRHR